MAIAPIPRPRSARPPATGDVPGVTPHHGGGPLGNALGWNGNPFYDGFRRVADSGVLDDIGYGLLNSTNIGDAFAMAGNRSLQMAPMRREERRETEMRTKYAELIGSWGDDYTEFAQGIADGAIDPADGYWKALEFKRTQDTEGEELARARTNAQFITDPELRGMVEAGAMPFADAYKYQQAGGAGAMPGLASTIYTGRDADGNIVPMQAGDNGRFYQTQMPEGIEFDPGALNAERAAGNKYGAGTGQAAFDLPTVEAQTEFAINNLNNLIYQTDENSQLMTDQTGQPVPNRGMQEQFGTGLFGLPTGQVLPAFPNTEKANFQARREQVQGQAFLQAIESLKGSGAVSEIEGLKATQAIIRAQTSQSEVEFTKAVKEAITIYERGLDSARQQAAGTQFTGGGGQQFNGGGGQPMGGMPTATNPATGETMVFNGQAWVPAQ